MDPSAGLPMAHSVSPVSEATDLAAVIRMNWDVEFARFFNFPISIPPSDLRPLPKSRIRSIKGTWIPASSPAILLVHKTNHESAYILSVTVPALASTVEEHYVPNLIFSWPQLPCISQFSVGGSRVIFASHMDSSNQVQKFALRFSSCSDAEAFINFVKCFFLICKDMPRFCEWRFYFSLFTA
ncbi:protein POOR HOMOLOGOUS SYNAPSIS 1-like [Zingiber officinale]|uniref:protein POOR HOMOLOGOUS SYNAPSIS 1-like n=1 Tax=Zingiber officinale TaxID=94328 RepID=UPI001C4BB5B8|nr:protein POOR HOMOLOGOUS SYNAPSIS 1-like [Zingiber officinale]